MIGIYHLFWIVPLSVVAGMIVTALMAAAGRGNGND